jgi:cytochrome b subunit of formate dehydrogenase
MAAQCMLESDMRWSIVPSCACAVVLLMCSLGSALAVEVSPAEIANRKCAECHSQPHIATLSAAERQTMVAPATRPSGKPEPAGPRPELLVDAKTLQDSSHAKIACNSCHVETATLPHPAHMAPASCNTDCHVNAKSDYLQGAHAEAVARGEQMAPDCVTCHGGHDILPRGNRDSRAFPLNIVKICGDCHARHAISENGKVKGNVNQYLDSVHGRALVQGGLAVSATCVSCHGSHKVLTSANATSTVNRANIASTCSKCHTGISEVFARSVHGQLVSRGEKAAPACADCHTAHAITRTDMPAFKLDIVSECGTCHDKPLRNGSAKHTLYQSYRESYHGQVTTLGFDRAARCSDCHGAHDVRRLDDPQSPLHADKRIEVCWKCHKGAAPGFARYQAHTDPTSFQRSGALYAVRWYFIIMMSASFGFFGLHSLLWFIRSSIEQRRRRGASAHLHNGNTVKRFSRVDRINHAFVIISFFGLTLTGLPLLYADEQWGRGLVGILGGPRWAGGLHRFFAIILAINVAVHLVGLARRLRRIGLKRILFGPYTMLPRVKDIKDCFGMWKWFFGLGGKPRFDRWTYWEKFDYMADAGGTAIIGLSGLLLWFPVFFSYYVPGWAFNIAQFVHGYEALLAIGFIFTIHFYNAHLRPEKFPVDDVMFSGSMPEEEFRLERPEEYARLVTEGRLEELRVKPPRRAYRVFAVCMGIAAMAVGTTLVVLIILAGLKWI